MIKNYASLSKKRLGYTDEEMKVWLNLATQKLDFLTLKDKKMIINMLKCIAKIIQLWSYETLLRL